MSSAATPDTRLRLIERTDVLCMLALMALGLGLRLAWFSGYGLGDDRIYRIDIESVLAGRMPVNPQNVYRFSWWLPTALSCRLLGVTEAGLILPVTAFATLGIGVVYALGNALWGRTGAWIAALLLVVTPLDFAWSTMLAGDIILSVFSALSVLFLLRALGHEAWWWKRRLWALSAASLWLGFHAKLSALLLLPAIVLICLLTRRRLDRHAAVFLLTAAGLFGLSLTWSYVFTGDPIHPYHEELIAQGLVGPGAFQSHGVASSDIFFIYPRWLFLRDNFGDLLYSVYPHLLVLFALLGPFLGLRAPLVVLCWLGCVFLGMEFNVQRVGNAWVAGFRNIRHTHVFVYPLILLLTGYLVGLRERYPRLGYVALGVLLAVSAWQSTSTASRTSIAFGDIRRAATFIAALPRKTIYSDFQVSTWVPVLAAKPPLVAEILPDTDPVARRAQLERIRSGYLITGGAREPYYGCVHCIPLEADVPHERWRLLKEFPGPPPLSWRPEALRVWEAIEDRSAG